jgi:D-3-phosphoglycerate dehydrogenase
MTLPRRRVLITESSGFTGSALTRLRDAADVVEGELDRAALIDAVCDVDVLWVKLRHRIDREVFQAAKRLTVLVTNTTGLNHVDLEAAAERGVRVLSLLGEVELLKEVRATAELTVGLALSLVRRIPRAARHVVEGGWNRDAFRARELFGKVAGVVGYGRLGRIVSRYLGALDMEVLSADPNRTQSEMEAGVRLVTLPDLLRRSDLVTVHVGLDRTTERFFGRAEFELMKQNAWFVNTARGELIDEEALLWSLGTGRIAGAALDVISGESSGGMASHPLVRYAREHDHLLITPHIGGNTVESLEKTERFLADKVVQELSSGFRGTL